jgi:hypothetical protein
VDFSQHVPNTNQMIVENGLGYIEKLEDGPIGNGVIDVATRLPANHDVAYSQNRKLLGDIRLLNLESFAEFAYTLFAVAKAVEDPNSNRMRQSLEKLRLEVGKLLRHESRFPAYLNLRILLCQSLLVFCRVIRSFRNGAAIRIVSNQYRLNDN